MSRQPRIEYPGALWHITSRGNERRNIFRTDEDRQRFVRLLAQTVEVRKWILHAWVLMNNHYHLLFETPEPNLSRGIKSLNQKYAQYFNKVHKRVGHLFQGRFKSILVEREGHLLELLRYVVLNPVRCGSVVDPAGHYWGSYRATAGYDSAPTWLEVRWTLDQFDRGDHDNARTEYRNFVASGRGVSYKPWDQLTGQRYLGSPDFCERMQSVVNAKKCRSDLSRRQRHFVPPDAEKIIVQIEARFGIPRDALKSKSRGPHRKALVHLATDHAGVTTRDLADWMSTTHQAISKLKQAAYDLYATDHRYRKTIDEILTALSCQSRTDPSLAT